MTACHVHRGPEGRLPDTQQGDEQDAGALTRKRYSAGEANEAPTPTTTQTNPENVTVCEVRGTQEGEHCMSHLGQVTTICLEWANSERREVVWGPQAGVGVQGLWDGEQGREKTMTSARLCEGTSWPLTINCRMAEMVRLMYTFQRGFSASGSSAPARGAFGPRRPLSPGDPHSHPPSLQHSSLHWPPAPSGSSGCWRSPGAWPR